MTTTADALALGWNNRQPQVPAWMRSNGLNSADWAVITEYMGVLAPLKKASERLERRGKSGKHGAIYEVIPVFEYLLGELQTRCQQYGHVDFDAHLRRLKTTSRSTLKPLGVRRTTTAANSTSRPYTTPPAASTRDINTTPRTAGLTTKIYGLRRLRLLRPPTARSQAHKQGDIDDIIDAIADYHANENDYADELEQWRKYKPQWIETQYAQGNVVRYWIDLAPKYPNLSHLAIDILTIPASSCECERLFSELCDLLEPKRRKTEVKLLAALPLIRSWVSRGFTVDQEATNSYTDEEMDRLFGLDDWDTEDMIE
jgi:hypothetical protein